MLSGAYVGTSLRGGGAGAALSMFRVTRTCVVCLHALDDFYGGTTHERLVTVEGARVSEKLDSRSLQLPVLEEVSACIA